MVVKKAVLRSKLFLEAIFYTVGNKYNCRRIAWMVCVQPKLTCWML